MPELLVAVSAGIGATVTPCVLPLYPGFLAYITSAAPAGATGTGTTLLPDRPPPAAAALLVWLGVVLGMVFLGGLLALLSLSLGRVLSVILPIIDLVIIGLGVLLLLGRNPFTRIPQPSPPRSAAAGRTSARSSMA